MDTNELFIRERRDQNITVSFWVNELLFCLGNGKWKGHCTTKLKA